VPTIPALDPLRSVYGKLVRAEEHILVLETELANDARAIGVEALLYPDRTFWVLKIVQLPDVPARWWSIAGDAVHNLRSALDHLAWQLALHHRRKEGKQPSRSTAFPLCASTEEWASESTTKKLRHISEEDRVRIEGVQPYQGANAHGYGPYAVLSWLAWLSNLDKHQEPPLVQTANDPFHTQALVRAASGMKSFQPSWSIAPTMRIGDELVRIELFEASPNPQVVVDFNYTLRLHLIDGNGPRLDTLLRQILDCVRAMVADFLGSFYERPLQAESSCS